MATVQIRVSSHRKYDIICGQTVYLCLTPAWANRTVDGTRRVLAIVRSGPHTSTASCLPPAPSSCCGTSDCCDTPTALPWYTYCIEYNDDLLLDDPSTNAPYLIDPCVDVLSIILDTCLVDSLVSTEPDIVVVSGDAGNIIIEGTDGGAFLDCDLISDACGETTEFTFLLDGDIGTPETVVAGNTVSILGGQACHTMIANPDTILVEVDLSTDAGQVLEIGTDGGLLVVGGGGGPIVCADVRNCINVDGFITGDGSPGTPFTVIPSTDADNTVSYGTDGNVFGQTDSFSVTAPTPIGGTNIQHIAADGDAISFPTGFNSVLAAVVCADVGVGVGRMVRDISLADQQLIVDAAPEHTHIVSHGAFNGNPGTDISPLGTYSSGASGILNISNSTCRTVRGAIRLHWSSNVLLQTTGVWRFEGRLSINGGAFNLISATQWGPYPGTTGTVWFMYADIPQDILAGALLMLQWDMRIVALTASAAGSVWSQFNSGIAYQGGTI